MTEPIKTNEKEASKVTVEVTKEIRNSGKKATNITQNKVMMIQGDYDLSGKEINAIIKTEV